MSGYIDNNNILRRDITTILHFNDLIINLLETRIREINNQTKHEYSTRISNVSKLILNQVIKKEIYTVYETAKIKK